MLYIRKKHGAPQFSSLLRSQLRPYSVCSAVLSSVCTSFAAPFILRLQLCLSSVCSVFCTPSAAPLFFACGCHLASGGCRGWTNDATCHRGAFVRVLVMPIFQDGLTVLQNHVQVHTHFSYARISLQNCGSRLGIGEDVPPQRLSACLASDILARTGLLFFEIMDHDYASSIITVMLR